MITNNTHVVVVRGRGGGRLISDRSSGLITGIETSIVRAREVGGRVYCV